MLFRSGGTAIEELQALDKDLGAKLREAQTKAFLVAVCGFEDAITRVEEAALSLQFPLEIHCVDTLTDSDKAFSESSSLFAAPSDRVLAKQLATDFGEKLERKWPLGFGNCEALVTFFSNCPNNTLPIIYKSDTNWTALFQRK